MTQLVSLHTCRTSLLVLCLTISSWPGIASAEPYKVYYGHVHNHSNLSDAKGSPEKAYDYAQHVAGLDFFGLADHAERLNAREWATMQHVAQVRNQDGVFVTFWGFEWSHSFHGHVTVIQTDDYTSARKSNTNSFAELLDWLSARKAVAFLNHPGRQNKTGVEFSRFNTAPSPHIVGMDLFNKIKGFEKYYYNEGYFRNDRNKGFYDEALSMGWRIGAGGSDDNHDGTWGTRTDYRLAVLAEAKTRSAIYSAMIARRFYSTLDKNLSLSFEICNRQMGSLIEPGNCECTIRATDADSEVFEEIQLIRNGALNQVWHPYAGSPAISASLTLRNGEYYYVKVTQADGDEAISSPIWVSSPPTPETVPAPVQPAQQ